MFDKNTFMAFVAGALIAIAAAAFFSAHPLSERTATASLGTFINGNYIPPGTSPAQIPSHHEEDDYGSAAGKGD
jgi:hypothetical protein